MNTSRRSSPFRTVELLQWGWSQTHNWVKLNTVILHTREIKINKKKKCSEIRCTLRLDDRNTWAGRQQRGAQAQSGTRQEVDRTSHPPVLRWTRRTFTIIQDLPQPQNSPWRCDKIRRLRSKLTFYRTISHKNTFWQQWQQFEPCLIVCILQPYITSLYFRTMKKQLITLHSILYGQTHGRVSQ